ncbi:MAG: cysteine desulfurase NifS [Proteobacteria bacterium]|nr:cysteine desulfurase NifS [Pseudomonadota bacterium]
MKKVYFDHNATTPIHPKVRSAIEPFLGEKFGNPSSIHWAGREVRAYVEEAREKVASLINSDPSEVIFTSCGSEGDNMAIKGVLMGNLKKGRHIVTTVVEHPAVFRTCKFLEDFDFEVTYVPVDSYGMIDPDDVRKAIRKDTVLISVMFANNETGNLFPIKEISAIAKENDIVFHTDAVQVVGKIPIDVKELGVDLLTASGHKFNAPKGIGFQYIRKGVKILPLISGGHQERELRAGTENMLGIVAIGEASQIAKEEMNEKSRHIGYLRDRLEKGILETIPYTVINGHPEKRLYNTTNISFKFIEAEALLVMLDMNGIAVSTGSACSSGATEPSYVLQAMSLDPLCSRGALRFSLGYGNTEEDVDYCLSVLPSLVEKIRKMSPFYKK